MKILLNRDIVQPAEASWPRGQRKPWSSNFFKIVGFSELFMFRPKIFRLLLSVKMEALNYIGKYLSLAFLFYRCHDTSDNQQFERSQKLCSSVKFIMAIQYNTTHFRSKVNTNFKEVHPLQNEYKF